MKNFNFLIYKAESEDIAVNAVIKDETIWLTQKSMAELFQCSADNISLHLKNMYKEGELLPETTTEEFSTVQKEGNRQISRKLACYNLDAIISVRYRVNSSRATQFRIWATKVLKEYIKKGFVLDDERLKQGKTAFDKYYFKELLERVRSRSEQVNAGFSSRLQIFLQNAALITTKTHLLQKSFTPPFKTNFTMRLLGILRRKLFTKEQIETKNIWDYQHGKMLLTGEF